MIEVFEKLGMPVTSTTAVNGRDDKIVFSFSDLKSARRTYRKTELELVAGAVSLLQLKMDNESKTKRLM